MDNIFLKNAALGTLNILNVYEFYEIPRLFSVENEVGSTFIVYWIGDCEYSEKWYLIPISRLRLNRFENKDIDIHDALVNQEQQFFFEVEIPFDGLKTETWKSIPKLDIGKINLPKKGLFISEVTPIGWQSSNASELNFATHEIRISKTSEKISKTPKLEHVTRLFENFGTLYKSFLDTMNIASNGIEPISARPGSFILSFQAEHLYQFESKFKILNEMISKRIDIVNYMKQNQIDIRSFTALLGSVFETSTNFELKDNATDSNIFVIRKSDAAFYLPSLTKSAVQYLSSYQVPQANDLEKIFKLADLTWQGLEVNAASLKVDPRHVAYYRHAAKTLGFFESNGSMTAIGQQLAESGRDKKLKITAKCFESSYCGWAWITWAGVQDLRGLESGTASVFLKENCPNLSATTSKRRASTLSTWCDELQEHYSEW